MTKTILKIASLVVLLGSVSVPAVADITDVVVPDTFAYVTHKTIRVNIQINTPSPDMTGLSFYTKGVDGLRLLDTRVIGTNGVYKGTLTLPSYVRNVVVKSRWQDSFKEVELSISAQSISAVIDHS